MNFFKFLLVKEKKSHFFKQLFLGHTNPKTLIGYIIAQKFILLQKNNEI